MATSTEIRKLAAELERHATIAGELFGTSEQWKLSRAKERVFAARQSLDAAIDTLAAQVADLTRDRNEALTKAADDAADAKRWRDQVASLKDTERDDGWKTEARAILRSDVRNRFVAAVRLCRERQGVSLMDAKAAVEALQQEDALQ